MLGSMEKLAGLGNLGIGEKSGEKVEMLAQRFNFF
jgi:hypothetical protein